MNQTGVKQYVFPLDSEHRAIWDSAIGPDGKLYFGLGTEISTCGYVRLCEYDYASNSVNELVRVEEVIMPSHRAIRASKFHTSINFLPDGRMIMTTHTTDKPPAYPTWMPEAYHSHLWEGFAGSNIIIYDPKTGNAQNLGIPVPHETIYGSIYDREHNALYSLGMLRGHVYRISLDDLNVKDMGKVSECYSFRLLMGPDGNLYGASKSGYVYKVDTKEQKIIDMNYKLPYSRMDYTRSFNNISNGSIGPDGRLYMSIMYADDIVALDTSTGKFENMGPYKIAKRSVRGENRNIVWGLDFDNNGVLWYVVTSANDGGYYSTNTSGSDVLEYGLPSTLYRWDIARGGKPEYLGMLGTKQRVPCHVSEVIVDKNNILYAVGTNHGYDGPDITAIDLNKFEPNRHELDGDSDDPFLDRTSERYIEQFTDLQRLNKIARENSFVFSTPAKPPVRLWRALAPDNIENSNVTALVWDDQNTLHGICGTDRQFAFSIKDGKLSSIKELNDCSPEYKEWLINSTRREIPSLKSKYKLPSYPGRQYKAVPVAEVELTGGRRLVGTEDGMLCIIDGDKVFSLGSAAPNGPIRDMAAKPDKSIVYGVAGDEEDLGYVFSYDDENGLIWLGNVYHDYPDEVGTVCSNVLSSVAISPDGKTLAIGADERLGCVVLYDI